MLRCGLYLHHVAVQVHVCQVRVYQVHVYQVHVHSEYSHSSWSRSNPSAPSMVTRSKRTSSRGRNWPSRQKAAEITLAGLGSPPVVWCSTKRIIGCPPGGAWTAPKGTPSVIMCLPWASAGEGSAGPCRRIPMRLDSSLTRYLAA